MIWMLSGLLLCLFLVGFGAFVYTFVRRPIPDSATEEGRKAGGWEAYTAQIVSGTQWLSKQEVKPVQVISYDGKCLYGRFVARENAKGTILFVHGYRSHFTIDFSASMEFYHRLGYHALYCDQRATGKSEGNVLTFGIKEHKDVLSWVTYLGLMLGQEHPIFLAGVSMGAATVLMASGMEFPANVRGIIADCGFTSPGDQLRYLLKAKYHLPAGMAAVLDFYARVFGRFSIDQWSAVDAVKQAKYPVILFHGLADKLVPSEMSQRVYDACTGKKRLELFEDAGHGVSYLVDTQRYQKALIEFLEENNPGEEQK